MRSLSLLSGIAPLAIGLLAAPAATAGVPIGDEAFGLVGTGGKAFAARFGLKYFTIEGNYTATSGTSFYSTDPAYDPEPGFSVVREVAKLNVRNDNLGETNVQFQAKLNAYAKALATWYPKPSFLRGSKPTFAWYQPDAAALVRAESLQIVETIRREKARNPQMTGTVWEIGNEPNLFPAILPAEYAAIFEAYRRVIKAEDPQAVVAMGSLFLPEPAADLKARLSEELATRMQAELTAAGLYGAISAAGYFDDLCRDLENTMLSRMLALPTREYLKQVLAATSARPDLVTLHVYGYDDRAPVLDSAAMRAILDTTFAGVQAQLRSQGATGRIWITEFGNIEQGKDEEAVALQTERLVAAFRARDSLEKWFRYKSTGADEQFALFSTGSPPLTRLAADAAFAPAGGAFACAHLNAVGRKFYALSHGGAACAERIGFASAASSRSESGSASISVVLDAPSHQAVSVSYAVRSGSASPGDYAQGTGTVTLAAGETSKSLSFASVDDGAKEGDETAVLHLHEPSGAVLTGDSVHVATFLDDDNGQPVVDSVRPIPVALAEGDSLRLRAHGTDPEGDAITYIWLRQNGDTLGIGTEVIYRPSYRHAGTEALQLLLLDSKGGKSIRQVDATVANTALRPAVANASGSSLAPGAPVQWSWPGGLADPDYDPSTLRATFEFRFDSASADASHRLEGVQGSATALIAGPAGPVWVRVSLKDGAGRESPWSDPRRLQWAGSASGIAGAADLSVPAVLTLAASAGRGGSAFQLGLPRDAKVVLEALAADGSLQVTLYRGRLPAGYHDIRIPGPGRGTGLRILRLRADGASRTLLVPVLP